MEKKPIAFICHYLSLYKKSLLYMLILLIIGQSSIKCADYYLADIFVQVSSSSLDDLWKNIGTNLAFWIGLVVVGRLLETMPLSIQARFLPGLRSIVAKDCFSYVNQQSIAYFCQEMSGNIANKISQLTNGVIEIVGTLTNAGYSILILLITLVLLSIQSLYLGVFMAVWILAAVLYALRFGTERAALSKEVGHRKSLANGVLVDSISNYSEVKSFANFNFERINLFKYLARLRKAESKEQKFRSRLNLLHSCFMAFSILLFMLFSLWLLSKNQLTATSFIYVNTLFMQISGLVFHATWTYNQLASKYGQVNAALEALAVKPQIIDSKDAQDLITKRAEIVFDNVSFSYPDKKALFNKLNIRIQPGEKIGLVGRSGSGKSTFIKLLSRYYDTSKGSVKINGCDLRDIKQDSLHKNIAVIPQDICLFNRSMYDNIRYGKIHAERDEIIKAAQKAYANKFIESFPKGYDTIVGERGVILSGGERQRIAIARAILKNAPILIFDEATSALDSESEAHIQKSLKQLMKNKTVIAIAHRLSTLREMDRILVFDNGKVIEEGSHLSLLRKKGVYAELYKMQVDGFVSVE